jgi:5-methylcytosine-specific restriction enzyme subunit McrC
MNTVRVRLQEWQTADPRGPQGAELQGARLDGPVARALARRLSDAGILDVLEGYDGISIRSFAHVGRIQIGSLCITIEPKIGTSELLTLLRYAYGLRNLQLCDETGFSTVGQLLQDLLAMQLLAEVQELLGRGLVRRYVARTELLASPRGSLDLNHLARRGPLVDAQVLCRHHLRSPDHLLNQVVRAGVRLAASRAQDAPLRQSLTRLGRRLGDEISEVRLDTATLERARRRLDRLASAYAAAFRLTELVYACSAVSLDGETTMELPGFLFDMNRFFQALIGRFLSEHLPSFRVQQEHALTEMMRYVPGLNPRHRKSPTPRPDFVVTKGGAVASLLDAKYRDLWERDLPREMLYQLAMYALSQPGGATATILYPTTARDATEAAVEIRDPVCPGALGRVALRPVILSELVHALGEPQGRGRCERLAGRLAFGGGGTLGAWEGAVVIPL